MTIEKEVQTAMETVINHLKDKLKGLRTGRANPAILDHIVVDIYGTSMKLKSLASITVPEPRQLLVTPFDINNVNAIVKAIDSANLNLQAKAEGKIIRINIPPMDESMRKKIVTECKKTGEESKVALRNVRRDFNEKIKKQKSAGELTEDDVKREENTIQKLTDKYCKLCDDTCSAKEKEILAI